MKTFVLMRQESYADIVAKTVCGVVRKTESELLGIIPQEGDCFIIDAHYKGTYADLEGLKVVGKLVDFITDCSVQIKLFSWFSENYLQKHYNLPFNQLKHKVTFKQFPYENLKKYN
ncbi:MAG: hypothetical protein M0Q41_02095 [Bacteroidales bacterium]|nr:hypothetical protein [Acholeplasmataceae bacterium]MCK9447748.1 hypothetical protein [Bacteroidales bacterium]